WTYSAFGALGFTIEHGNINFHPPYARGVAELSDGVMKGFMIMGRAAANPRYHSVLGGRVAAGRAKLTLTKKFKTPLSEGNPLGKKFVTEKLKFTLTTRADGSFTWHVPQSIRPYENKRESYTLTVTADGKKTTTKVLLDRGERLNLGTIRL
ncbi:MAG TPA: hypothetical protein VM784_06120, partial [Actinomycetota bacterium]|nr:hypothetical protein [Actinomycetota bacterium]